MRANIKEFDGKNAEHAPEAESRDFSEERGSSGTLKRWEKENIIYCLLTKSKHAQLRAKKKKSCVLRFNNGKEKHLGITSTITLWKAAEIIWNGCPKLKET